MATDLGNPAGYRRTRTTYISGASSFNTGRTDISGTRGSIAHNVKLVTRVYLPVKSLVTNLLVYQDSSDGTDVQFKGIIFADAAGPAPGARLAVGTIVSIPGSSTTWYGPSDLSGAALTLDPGYYWIGVHVKSAGGAGIMRPYGDWTTGSVYSNSDNYDDGVADPFGSGTPGTGTPAIYITCIPTLTGTFTALADTKAVRVTAIGGGGGGGGSGAGGRHGSGGGGGGAWAQTFHTDPNYITGVAYTVGAGGAGGTTAPSGGDAGGTTNWRNGFNNPQALGGVGGGGSTGTNDAGGGGGNNGSGDAQAIGSAGSAGMAQRGQGALGPYGGGRGGNSAWGFGQGGSYAGVATGSQAAGKPGKPFGGGGGGAVSTGGSAQVGGAGGGGLIIVEEYTKTWAN